LYWNQNLVSRGDDLGLEIEYYGSWAWEMEGSGIDGKKRT
jgi:hypothetical protein